MNWILIHHLFWKIIVNRYVHFTVFTVTFFSSHTLIESTTSSCISFIIIWVWLITLCWSLQTWLKVTTLVIWSPFNRLCKVTIIHFYRFILHTYIITVQIKIMIVKFAMKFMLNSNCLILVILTVRVLSNCLSIIRHKLWKLYHPWLKIKMNFESFINNESSWVIIKAWWEIFFWTSSSPTKSIWHSWIFLRLKEPWVPKLPLIIKLY